MFEKKRGKRFLASVMALVMLLSLAPVGALAVEDEEQNQEVVALPANQADPKPVVTDEGNTANTNEEPTPPPHNEGDTIILTDNNNTSTAISEAEIIPEKELIDEAFGVDSKEEIQQYGSKENGNAVVQYSVSGSNTVKVGETITLTCDNNSHWHNHNWYTFGNSVAVEGDTASSTITVKGLKEGTATVYCGTDSKKINVTDPQYVIRFYVSGTRTDGLYTEQNKYSVAGQPNSTFEDAIGKNPLELSVSAGYAILTGYNDTAKNISTNDFKDVSVTGDEAVRAWLTEYANYGVPEGLTNRENVESIVAQVNEQYNTANTEFYNRNLLPSLQTNYFNGFRFVDAYYVKSGESTIHVNVQLVKNTEYTVHYDSNDGTENVSYDSDLYQTGDSVTVKNNMFTRTGYKFVGWNTEVDGTGTKYDPDNTFNIENANVTLYAQWEAKEYEVKYDLNYVGATEEYATKEKVHWENDKLLPTTNPTRTGYEFKGWYTATTGGKKVTDTTTYASIAGNDATPSVTLYAHWNQDSKPTTESTPVYVYFKIVDAAGNNIKDKSKINNDDLKKTAYNNDADKKTWATLGKIASAETLTDGTEYKGTNTTLVTVGNEAKDQLKNDGALYTDNKKIANTVLANIEWFQLKQWAGATDYVPDGSRWHLDGKITGYTVTYNNGTTEATDAVHNMPDADEMYYLRGSEYTVSNATPTRDGYVFTGWKSDNNVYASKSKMNMPAKNVVLTAQWEKDELVDPSVDKPAGITKGDGIADKYQIQVSFKAVNGTFKNGENSITEYTTVVTKYTSGEPSENGTAKLANQHLKAEKPDAGFTEPGSWKKGTDACEKPKADDSVQNGDHFVVTFEQEKESVADPIHYTINQHFIDAQKADKIKSTPKQATEVKTFGDSIPEEMLAVKQDFGDPKQNYVYVPAETTYKVGNQKKETTDNLANGAVIDLYYYLDVIGGKDEKGNLIDKGDEIPDCYQVTIIYKSSDESRGKISDASLKKEVLTIKDEEGNRLSSGKVEITGASAEVTGSRCYFVNWTKKQEGSTASSTVISSANLPAQTIENAKGGDVYTFTANFDRSSGGGGGGSNRPKPPVVEIPDDVPTGLNGKDHYAYIIGYGNNDVRPQNNITRAEVATIFFRLLTDETRTANMTKSNSYNDVKDGDWFCCAVSTLSKMGIIKGYEDGSFKPNDPISRAEFAAIAARFDPDGDKTPATFADVTSHWAKDEISIAANHGWIKGYEDGSFKPDQKITRAETMTLVNRVLNRLPETKDDLHKDMKTWVDNMDETAWYYLAVQEATNSHYFKNKTSTKFEQWTDLRDTRDWSELEK